MNEQERIALTEKVRRSENPYQALMGADAVNRGSGSRWNKRVLMPTPPSRLFADRKQRTALMMKVNQRTLQIMKRLDPDLFADIYDAEMKLAIAKLAEENPDQDLVRKYGRRLVPAKGSGNDG